MRGLKPCAIEMGAAARKSFVITEEESVWVSEWVSQ